jgi:DNA-binding transcriptional ArsR family regulator
VERTETEHEYRVAWKNPIALHVASVIAAYTGLPIAIVSARVSTKLPPGHLGTFERPGRTRLLLALAGHEPATVGEVSETTGMTLSMVHAAAETLEDAGIIIGDRKTRPMA